MAWSDAARAAALEARRAHGQKQSPARRVKVLRGFDNPLNLWKRARVGGKTVFVRDRDVFRKFHGKGR